MLNNAKRIVVKVGSALIAEAESGTVRAAWLDSLASGIAALHKEDRQVIVVTSGAVALGRGVLGFKAKSLELDEKQAAAACGQILLAGAWRDHLAKVNIPVAQLLLSLDDSEDRRRYLNARATLETLLKHGVLPVINENDTVATDELKFGDNDRLAARVAQMAGADALILLSDIDGLYTKNPKLHQDARHIPEVRRITPEIERMAGGAVSGVGAGGMATKIEAAKIALASGCHMAIMEGAAPSPLSRLTQGAKCTWFLAGETPGNARKRWIAGTLNPMGSVTVDDGAARALGQGKSLLPAGVKAVEGRFEAGDAVLIKGLDGSTLGKGLIAYGAADAARILGKKSEEIERILGFKGKDVLIHRDDMVPEQM